LFAESPDVPENATSPTYIEQSSFLGDLHRQITDTPGAAKVRLRVGQDDDDRRKVVASHSDVIAAVQAADHVAVSRLLGNDPALASARDANGVSAIMHAFYARQPEIAEVLIAAKPGLDIFEATAAGKTDKVSEILNRDSDASRQWSADGFTALHFAAFFNRSAIARELIQHGSDIDAIARNPMKVTPLHSAAAAHSGEIVRLLLERGANPNARQQGGWTPLHAAAQDGDAEMVRALVEHHADPKATNDEGKTPGDIATEKGHVEIAARLSQ
jgi:ankyrin repeat protein